MELRATLNNLKENENTITGLIPYNSTSEYMGFTEEIRQGAFKYDDVIVLYNHDRNKVLGSTKNKTLELRDSENGLQFKLNPIDTSYGQDALKLIKSGTNTGVSFGFNVIKDSWNGDKRSLEEIQLNEISICVTTPAYKSAYARNKEEGEKEMNKKTEEIKIEERETKGVLSMGTKKEIKKEEIRTLGANETFRSIAKGNTNLSLGDVIRCMANPNMVQENVYEEFRTSMMTSGNKIIIPQILSSTILDVARNQSAFMGNIPVAPMVTNNLKTLKVKTPYDGVALKNEGEKGAYGTVDFEGVDLQSKTFFGLLKLTIEDLQSANLESIIKDQLGKDLGAKVDKFIIDKISKETGIINKSTKKDAISIYDTVEDTITEIQGSNYNPTNLVINSQIDGTLRKARATDQTPLQPTQGFAGLNKRVSNSVNNIAIYQPSALLMGVQKSIVLESSTDVFFESGEVVFRIYMMCDVAVIEPKAMGLINLA